MNAHRDDGSPDTNVWRTLDDDELRDCADDEFAWADAVAERNGSIEGGAGLRDLSGDRASEDRRTDRTPSDLDSPLCCADDECWVAGQGEL